MAEPVLPERLLDARILVIDDEPPNVALVTGLLERAGYRNVEGRTGPPTDPTAMGDPDVVLLDLLMPAMDGFEVLGRIRGVGLTDLDLPVLVLTADATRETKLRAFRAGASDFLTKPFDVAEVLLRVRLHLERRLLHRDSLSYGERLERTVAEQTDELLQLVRGLQERTVALAGANAKLRESEEQRSWFFTTASHELRTPLTAVTGFARTLRHRWDDLGEDERLEFIGSIDRQGRRLAQLTEDLLAVAATDREGLAVDLRPTDVASVVDLAVEGFTTADAEIRVNVAPALEVIADAERLAQILVNLIANAVKYGMEPIGIDARHVEDGIEVSVRDHGHGVPPDLLGHLFRRYARSATQEDQVQQGFGLGLAISAELARVQGGTLRYEDAAPGARFVLRLPALGPSEERGRDGPPGSVRRNPAHRVLRPAGSAGAVRTESRRGESNP